MRRPSQSCEREKIDWGVHQASPVSQPAGNPDDPQLPRSRFPHEHKTQVEGFFGDEALVAIIREHHLMADAWG